MGLNIVIDSELWPLIDRLIQWLIIPAIVVLWSLHSRQNESERHILRLMTIMEERDKQYQADNRHAEGAFNSLKEVIEKLSERMDRFLEHEK